MATALQRDTAALGPAAPGALRPNYNVPVLPAWADYRRAGSWAGRFRQQRFAFFTSLMRQLPDGPVRVLDVGGTPEFWRRALADAPSQWHVVVLNLAPPRTVNPTVTPLRGDACRLPFANGTFDVVFSNSVIEHVGTLEDQRRMANEIQRVGRRYFVQTPNRYFPIEPHFLLPFGQFLPKAFVAALLQRTNLGTIHRRPDPRVARAIVDEIRLLTLAEVRRVFPSAALYKERFAGLTKSFVAYGGWDR